MLGDVVDLVPPPLLTLGMSAYSAAGLADRTPAAHTLIVSNVPGPDFPTGGLVYGQTGIREAYTTGRGRVVMRARAHVEDRPSGGEVRRHVVARSPCGCYAVTSTYADLEDGSGMGSPSSFNPSRWNSIASRIWDSTSSTVT